MALIDPAIVDRLEPNGAADRILNAQTSLLRRLVSDDRSKRMAEQAARDPKGAYPPSAMLADLRNGIWSELKGDPVDVDLYRRNLQRAHLELLIGEVSREIASSDLPALCRAELKALLGDIISSIAFRNPTSPTFVHLDDLKARIEQALQPKAVVQPSAPANAFRVILGGDADEPDAPR